jgi:hypothetical protein
MIRRNLLSGHSGTARRAGPGTHEHGPPAVSQHLLHRVSGEFADATTTVDPLVELHRKSLHNRERLSESKICACFYCLNEFDFAQIIEWVDNGDTALCPFCSVDSVLGFDTRPIDRALLSAMHDRWFKISVLTASQWKEALESGVWPQVPE